METITFDQTEWVIPEGWRRNGEKPTTCRSCDSPVLWVLSKNNRLAPLNPDGINHFATCPQASSWRKR